MIREGLRQDTLLGFAENGAVATCFMQSVFEAATEDSLRGEKRRWGDWFFGNGPYIVDNRARIARYFLECTDKQWLWMLDNDIKFPADSLYRLLDAAEEFDYKVIGAAYWNQYPGTHCYLSWLVFTTDKLHAVPELPEDRSVPCEVSSVGMGCTLIHRDVLQDVANRHPNDPWDTFGQDILVQFADGEQPAFVMARSPEDFDEDMLLKRPIARIDRCGEDVTFCLRARREGHQIWGLPSLEVEHFKPHFMNHGDGAPSIRVVEPDLAEAV
jgi:hypothetical protein